jgi:hypothetical protein
MLIGQVKRRMSPLSTQDMQESSPILIVVKDLFLTIASGRHMTECLGILDAQRMGH